MTLPLMIAGAALYALSFLCFLLQGKKKIPAALPLLLWIAGEGCNLAVVVQNYLRNGYVPFVSMFQVLTFLAACFLPVYFYVTYVCRCKGCGPYFALAAAVVLTGPVFMQSGAVWTFPPALQSHWFVPHILMYMLAYTLGTVTFLMVAVYLLGKRKNAALFRSLYCCARTAFPFMTAGMFFGAIWADQVWGSFWSWDLKECWSLLAWLCYLLLLHCYRREKLRKWVPLFAILGFAAIIVTMFFVTGMVKMGGGGSMHAYN